MEENQESKIYLTLKEYSLKVSLSEKTIRRRIEAGQIPSWQPGGPGTRILIPASSLQVCSIATPKKLTDEDQSAHIPKEPRLPGPIPGWKQM